MAKYTDGYAKYLYAVVGSGEFLLEKGKELGQRTLSIADARRKDTVSLYEDLAKRGERIVGGLKDAKPVEKLTEGTKQAQKQLKGAVTSVRKALGMVEEKTPAKTTTRKAS